MLYEQLTRVNEIDSKINGLHQSLADLYAERAKLISGEPAAKTKKPAAINTKPIYDKLALIWNVYGIKLPAYKTLSKKLDKAVGVMAHLQAENPHLHGKLEIVAVPPYKSLAKLLDSSLTKFEFAEADILEKAAKHNVWSFVVIALPEFGLQVNNLETFLASEGYRYKDYDCRGLGVQEMIAAELQGVSVVSEGRWTLLLKDAKAEYVPCVSRHTGKLVFDLDDTGCLLGNNYLQPAIKA